MTNARGGTKHEKKTGGIIESEGKYGGVHGSRGQGAGRTIFRPLVVEGVPWPTTNLHIHIKSKVSLHANWT